MAEMGMEAPKITLGQRVKEAFTTGGAREKWYRDHKELVSKYADISNGLSDEQRAQAMAQIESDAAKSAKINVAGHWGGLAAVTGTIAVGTALLIKPELAGKVADQLKKINIKGHNFGLERGARAVESGALRAQDFLKHLPTNAKDLAVRAGEGIKTGASRAKDAVAGIFKKKPPVPPIA